MNQNKTVVIYHRADFDGIFCREIARKFLPNATLIGWDYGDSDAIIPPGVEAIYMLDISIESWMNDPRLIWIDHHKSAMEKYGPKIGYQIDGVAACRLAWQWFALISATPNPEEFALPDKQHFYDRQVQEPLAVRLAGEYDIWDKRDPDAELFQHGLRSQEITPELWCELLDNLENKGSLITKSYSAVHKLLKAGEAIRYAKTQENKEIIESYGFTVRWQCLNFLCCNHARFNSHLFTAGIKPEHDALLGFKWTGTDWSVSLYGVPGKPDIDLSVIAVKYGGGGHKQACGFRTKTLPFFAA